MSQEDPRNFVSAKKIRNRIRRRINRDINVGSKCSRGEINDNATLVAEELYKEIEIWIF